VCPSHTASASGATARQTHIVHAAEIEEGHVFHSILTPLRMATHRRIGSAHGQSFRYHIEKRTGNLSTVLGGAGHS